MPASAFTLEIGTGLSNSAVATALRVRIAIAGVSGVRRLKLCPRGVYGRGGVLAILGVFILKLKARGGVIRFAI